MKIHGRGLKPGGKWSKGEHGNKHGKKKELQGVYMYKSKRKKVKQNVMGDKKKWMKDLAQEAEEAATAHNIIGELYNLTKKMAGKNTCNTRPVRDKDGKKNKKNRKVPSRDYIPPEILKADPSTMADILYDLLNAIWEREEIPTEWKEFLLIKLPKTGILNHCGNWRGIMLLSVPSKILALTRVILERMESALEAKLREEQAGCRGGRSYTDQIVTSRIIVEQSIEWQSTLYLNPLHTKGGGGYSLWKWDCSQRCLPQTFFTKQPYKPLHI